MEMTNERAAEILNPAHYEDHDSLETVQEACRMGDGPGGFAAYC